MGAENENSRAQQRPPTCLETAAYTSTSSRIRKAGSDYIDDPCDSLACLPPLKKLCRDVVESGSTPRRVLKEATSVLDPSKQHHQSTPLQLTSASILSPQRHTKNISSATLPAQLDVDRNGGQDQPSYQHHRPTRQANYDHRNNEDNDNTKSSISFLDLPPEIRNMVYSYALQYPSCANLYKAYYSTLTNPSLPGNSSSNNNSSSISSPHTQARITYSTPTILLLCKDITAESQAILHARPLTIDRLPPFKSGPISCPPPHHDPYSWVKGCNDLTKSNSNSNSSGFLNISTFIPRRTLQNIHVLNLCIGLDEGPLGSAWAWERILGELFGPGGVLVQRNRLVKLRVLIRLCSPVCLVTGTTYARKDSADGVMNILGTFLSSGNPNVFHPPETTLEVWRVQGRLAWRREYGRLTCASNGRVCFLPAAGRRGLVLGVGLGNGQKAEEDGKSQPLSLAKSSASASAVATTKAHAEANGEQELASLEAQRTYPDEEMFPGSIMEFVRPLPPFFVSNDDGY